MDPLTLALSFVFGLIVGSFLNVVALRLNTGKGIGGRSMCMSCGRTLSWTELIPVASFLIQGGKCRHCHAKISWQYPLVELMAGVLFALIIWKYPPLAYAAAFQTLLYLVSACILIVICVYDIRHKIIPDRFSYAFTALSLIGLFVGAASWFHVPALSALLAGPILAAPFALIWAASRGSWMGLGDAKLTLGIGWMLGLGRGINALVLSFWIAAAVSLAWLFVRYGSFKPRTEIPFGPYLIVGTFIALLTGVQVIDVSVIRQILF